MDRWIALFAGVFVCLSQGPTVAAGALQDQDGRSPEDRALAFLAREVPRWSQEHRCFSCHNNGDAARALYTARRLGYTVPPAALADTSAFLAAPEKWARNGAEGPFSDKRLASLQFAAALVAAMEAGQIQQRPPLIEAARLVADDQADDGAWHVVAAGDVGSPTTYGRPLATVVARDILRAADPVRFRAPIERAERWLRGLAVRNVLQASSLLLAWHAGDAEAAAQRRRSLDLLRQGQSADGGWGPYVNAPPEVFDTALALWALARVKHEADVPEMIQRGRAYLVAAQSPDGSWPETTRPPGAISYAQRLSTTGWATLALLATQRACGHGGISPGRPAR